MARQVAQSRRNLPKKSMRYMEHFLPKMNRELVGAKQEGNSESNWVEQGIWLRFVKQQPGVDVHEQLRAIGGAPSCRARALVFFVLPFAEPYTGATAVFVDEFHTSALEGADDRGKGRRIARIATGFNIGHRVAVDLSGFGEVPHAPI